MRGDAPEAPGACGITMRRGSGWLWEGWSWCATASASQPCSEWLADDSPASRMVSMAADALASRTTHAATAVTRAAAHGGICLMLTVGVVDWRESDRLRAIYICITARLTRWEGVTTKRLHQSSAMMGMACTRLDDSVALLALPSLPGGCMGG